MSSNNCSKDYSKHWGVSGGKGSCSHGTLQKEDTPQILFQKVYSTLYTYSINGLKKYYRVNGIKSAISDLERITYPSYMAREQHCFDFRSIPTTSSSLYILGFTCFYISFSTGQDKAKGRRCKESSPVWLRHQIHREAT